MTPKAGVGSCDGIRDGAPRGDGLASPSITPNSPAGRSRISYTPGPGSQSHPPAGR